MRQQAGLWTAKNRQEIDSAESFAEPPPAPTRLNSEELVMDLCYHFFDRAAFDQIWGLSWREFRRRWNRGAWSNKPLSHRGDYSGDSLRDLIAFRVNPEPSNDQLGHTEPPGPSLDGETL